MVKVISLFFILILMSGCAGNNKQELEQELEQERKQNQKVTAALQKRIHGLEEENRKNKAKERRKFCSPLYETYNTCYAVGIMNSSNEQCMKAGIASAVAWASKLNLSENAKKGMMLFCGIACKKASLEEGSLSYNDFDAKFCNKE